MPERTPEDPRRRLMEEELLLGNANDNVEKKPPGDGPFPHRAQVERVEKKAQELLIGLPRQIARDRCDRREVDENWSRTVKKYIPGVGIL